MQLFYSTSNINLADLDGLVTLPEAARDQLLSANLRDGMPFVLSSEGEFDHVLNGFLRSLPHARVRAENSWRTYAHQIVMAADYVVTNCKRRSLLDATYEDLAAYKTARLTGFPPLRGQSWNVQVAALDKLFAWARQEKLILDPPFRYAERRVCVGGRFERRQVNSLYEDVAIDDIVRCISIEEYEFFRDVGLLGKAAKDDGEEADPRNARRDAAIAELLVTTGMRITECLSMFPEELPRADMAPAIRAVPVTLSAATTKNSKAREIIVSRRVMEEHVEPYRTVERAEAVYRAQASDLYETVPRKLLAVRWRSHGVVLVDGERESAVDFNLLKPPMRRRIFRSTQGTMSEPAVLWCTEQGLPLTDAAVRMTFERACARCNEGDAAKLRFGRVMDVTPHVLRHTFAVAHLNQLIRLAGLSIRRGDRGPEADDRERQRRVLRDPVDSLRRRLGHRSVETTYQYLTYLEDAKAQAFAAVEAWDELLSGRENPRRSHAGI